MICGEHEEGTNRVCDKEVPCTITHETDGFSWGTSLMPASTKKGSTRTRMQEVIDEGINVETPVGPPALPSLPYHGSSGHSGSETSAERAHNADHKGRTAWRQQRVLVVLNQQQERGITIAELREMYPSSDNVANHHGSWSGALSNLHQTGHITRLSERRGRCEIYVLPEYVSGRLTRQHGKNGAKKKAWDEGHSFNGHGPGLCRCPNPYI